MENELDLIANGEIDYSKVLSEFYQPFEKALLKVESEIENRITSYNVCYTKLLRINTKGVVKSMGEPRTVNLKTGGTIDVCDAIV